MDFESLLGVVGFHKSSEQKIHDFLEKTTGITIAPLPSLEVSDAPAWVDDVLSRINENSRKVIAKAVGNSVAVAVALGDKMLTEAYNIQRRYSYKTSELVLLGNSNRLVEDMGIPLSVAEVPQWRDRIVKDFKEKYQGYRSVTKKWSSGAHTVVAAKLLEIASQK